MSENKILSLPKGWEACSFGDIVSIQNGYAFKSGLFKKSKEHETDVPLIRQSQMKGTKIDISDAVFLAEEQLKKHPNYKITKGDVIIGMSGSIGKVCLYEENIPALQNQRTGKIIPYLLSELNPKFFGLFLSSIEQKLTKYAKGMGVQNISSKDIEQLPFALPPRNEQQRIVAKIEKLFSELDKSIETLKTAQAQLKVYRQALLKNAFEGKLTAQWRVENQDKLETTETILKQIQQEHVSRYQQQLSKWEASNKQSSKPREQKLLPPIPIKELTKFSVLPNGWAWIKLGEVFNIYVGSTPSRKRSDFWNGDIPWVSSGEVAFCKIKDTKEKITNLGYVSASTEVHPIGTVMLAMIGEGKTRGQAAILDIKACHNQNTAAIRVSETKCNPEFVYQYLVYQYEITRKIGSGNNQKALNKERVSDLIFPFCSYSEMNEVVRHIDEKLSVTDQLQQAINLSIQQAESLRQSILKRAFTGQLVPQDPNDEPASILLEQIKTSKVKL